MILLVVSYLFILGAVFGSFVAAMASRLHSGQTTGGRSRCEACHHALSTRDLIPVLSWLWLRGRCRYCKHSIGSDLLVIELMTGLAFAVSFIAWPYVLQTPLQWAFFTTWLVALVGLAFLFVYDMRHYLLPDVVVYPLMAVGGALYVLSTYTVAPNTDIWQLAVGAVLALLPITGVYGLLYTVSGGRWVGFGDVKLGVFIGLAVGWQGALLVLVLANVIGLGYVGPGLLTGRLTRTDRVPFGPFLIIATYIVMLWGPAILNWYLAPLSL